MRLILLAFLMFFISGCQNAKNQKKLKIAVSANMQYAIQPIVESFEKKYNAKCEVIVGSSGKLSAQIMAKAPFHIFISADDEYPETLHQKGLTYEKPRIYALGKLALWVADSTLISGINHQLNDSLVHHLAIANPKIAPYGKAAIEYLTNLNLVENLSQKIVFGESISQTNHYLLSGAANAGFTSLSSIISTDLGKKGVVFNIDSNLHSPIAQGAVILNTDYHDQAEEFFGFLFSEEVHEILRQNGYELP